MIYRDTELINQNGQNERKVQVQIAKELNTHTRKIKLFKVSHARNCSHSYFTLYKKLKYCSVYRV